MTRLTSASAWIRLTAPQTPLRHKAGVPESARPATSVPRYFASLPIHSTSTTSTIGSPGKSPANISAGVSGSGVAAMTRQRPRRHRWTTSGWRRSRRFERTTSGRPSNKLANRGGGTPGTAVPRPAPRQRLDQTAIAIQRRHAPSTPPPPAGLRMARTSTPSPRPPRRPPPPGTRAVGPPTTACASAPIRGAQHGDVSIMALRGDRGVDPVRPPRRRLAAAQGLNCACVPGLSAAVLVDPAPPCRRLFAVDRGRCAPARSRRGRPGRRAARRRARRRLRRRWSSWTTSRALTPSQPRLTRPVVMICSITCRARLTGIQSVPCDPPLRE